MAVRFLADHQAVLGVVGHVDGVYVDVGLDEVPGHQVLKHLIVCLKLAYPWVYVCVTELDGGRFPAGVAVGPRLG